MVSCRAARRRTTQAAEPVLIPAALDLVCRRSRRTRRWPPCEETPDARAIRVAGLVPRLLSEPGQRVSVATREAGGKRRHLVIRSIRRRDLDAAWARDDAHAVS